MDKSTKQVVEWAIVFMDSKYRVPIFYWLQPGFKHVFAMKKSPGGEFWMVIDPLRSHTDVLLIPGREKTARDYAGEDAVILTVKAKIDPAKPRWTIGLVDCVEVVKSLVGIRSHFVHTPYQLYRYLRREHIDGISGGTNCG